MQPGNHLCEWNIQGRRTVTHFDYFKETWVLSGRVFLFAICDTYTRKMDMIPDDDYTIKARQHQLPYGDDEYRFNP